MPKSEDEDQEHESVWDRAFREVARARDEGVPPDTSHFEDLTKASGDRK